MRRICYALRRYVIGSVAVFAGENDGDDDGGGGGSDGAFVGISLTFCIRSKIRKIC